MSQTVADLTARFDHIAPADRPAAVLAILKAWTAGRTDRAVPVPEADGRLFGWVVPLTQGDPPPTTPEEDAELARRLATRHRSRPLSDFIRRLGRG